METTEKQDRFTAPWLFAAAVFVFALALIEKGLNVVGLSLPGTQVYPRQLLDWAVALLNSGKVDWNAIQQCRDDIDAMLSSAEQPQRDAFLIKLREAQDSIEPHFQAVDEALAGAFREVKTRLGEALTAVPAGADA